MPLELNEEQQPVVDAAIESTIKVLAGAGTGKTRVLTARYLKFVFEDHVPPENLLALTFTKKAAAEMRERVFAGIVEHGDAALTRDFYGAWIMNFHQFAHRVIRENAAAFAIDPSVAVASEVDLERARNKVRQAFMTGSVDGLPQGYEDDMPRPNELDGYVERCLKIIDKARGNLWTPQQLLATVRTGKDLPAYERKLHTVIALWRTYEDELHRRLLLDFNDLISIVVDRFRTDEHLRQRYAGRFRHILVDEFQDTSEGQNEMVKLLSDEHFSNVTIVGDEKQSIYRWRDARVENIRDFEGDQYVLKQNYRSNQDILDLAFNVIIEDPYFEVRKEDIRLQTDLGRADQPVVLFHPPEGAEPAPEQEGRALAAWILELTGQLDGTLDVGITTPQMPLRFEQIAILMRGLKPSTGLPVYERALTEAGIPYAILGGVSTVEERVLELFNNMLRLLLNSDDVRALLAVLETAPLSLPDRDIRELFVAAGRRPNVATLVADVTVATLESAGSRQRVTLLRRLLEELDDIRGGVDLQAFVLEAMDRTQFYYQLFEEDADLRVVDSISKRLLEIVDGLTTKNEANLAALIEAIHTLLKRKQFGEEDAPYVPPGRVVIMTQHQAKGLEFDAVAVPGVKRTLGRSEGFFLVKDGPDLPEGDAPGLFWSDGRNWGRGTADTGVKERSKREHDQEERCLLYVAITRARHYLFVSSPFAEGIEKKGKSDKPTLFASVLRAAREGDIRHQELRGVCDQPRRVRNEVSSPRGAHDRMCNALSEWRDDRTRLSDARLAGSPRSEQLQFVTWRALHTFRTCPRAYEYRYVSGITSELFDDDRRLAPAEEPAKIDAGDTRIPAGMSPETFGSYIHEVFQVWYEQGGDVLGDDTLARLATRHGVAEALRHEVAARAAALLASYQQRSRGGDSAVHGAEYRVQRRSGNIVVHGIVDRIDRLADGYRLLDYKIGVARAEYDFQLRCYAWMLAPLDAPVTSAAVVYLRDNVDIHDVDVSDREIEKIGDLVRDFGDMSAQAVYSATPGVVCARCDYRSRCRDAQS